MNVENMLSTHKMAMGNYMVAREIEPATKY